MKYFRLGMRVPGAVNSTGAIRIKNFYRLILLTKFHSFEATTITKAC